MRIPVATLALLLLVVLPRAALAQDTLQVIVFPGAFNWPIWAAQDKGLFAREGLEVKLTPTPSSVFQLTSMIDVLLAPAGGFEPEGALDIEGIRTVLKIRSKYGRPQKELTDATRYYDLSAYERTRR